MPDLLPTPLTVIGAGPAGIMAAYTAAEAGVDVTLIDDNPLPGGQYYRQAPPEFQFSNPLDAQSGRTDAPEVLKKLPHPKIRVVNKSLVWGVFDQHNSGPGRWRTEFPPPYRPCQSWLQALTIARLHSQDGLLPGILGAGAAAHAQDPVGSAWQASLLAG
jgi:hypothetical protein